MKKYIFCFIFIFNIFKIYSFDFIYNNYEKYLLKNYIIKKLITTHYKFDHINNEILDYKFFVKYDHNHKIVEEYFLDYNHDKIEKSIVENLYDNKGNNIEKIQYYFNNVKVSKNNFQYNENGNLVSVDIFDFLSNDYYLKEKYFYDENNKVLKKTLKYFTDNKEYYFEYQYDKNNNIVKEIKYNSFNEIIEIIEYNYKNNEIIELNIKNKELNNSKLSRYKITGSSNFIKKIEILEYDENEILTSKIIHKFYVRKKSKTTSN